MLGGGVVQVEVLLSDAQCKGARQGCASLRISVMDPARSPCPHVLCCSNRHIPTSFRMELRNTELAV